MSDLPLERELLRAAAEECPPPSARLRGLATLGLLSVAGSVGATTAGASTGAIAAETGPVAAGYLSWLGWHGLAKWGLIVGLGGAAVGGLVVSTTTSDSAPPAVSAPTQPALPTPDPVSEAAKGRAAAPQAQPSPALGPDAAEPRAARVPARSAAPASSASASLRSEIDLLDRARASLAAAAPDAALARLAEYAARHPRGELREEAAVLRIQALRARGDDHAASAAERSFERRFPRSAHDSALPSATRTPPRAP